MGVLQQRLAAGWRMCPACQGVSVPTRDACFQCGQPFTPTPGAPAGEKRATAAASNTSARRRSAGALGSLATRPGHTLDITAYGLPQTQGSAVAVAPGVFKRHRGPELHAWRTSITAAAQKVCGPGWVAPNTALQLVTVFTVPAPARITGPQYPDGYRDLDKLIRAAADALSARTGFRVVASDMRYTRQIVEKTYPTPFHTHPAALDQPGVWLRVQPLTPIIIDGTTWSIPIELPTRCVSERTPIEGATA